MHSAAWRYTGNDAQAVFLILARKAGRLSRDIALAGWLYQTARLRAKVCNWKTLPNYPASGSEAVLQLKGSEVPFDPGSYKPLLSASLASGGIRLDFPKGVDAVAIYMRLRGTIHWTHIGTHSLSPHLDTTPLTVADVAEAREYMGRGVLHDQEIGLDNDRSTSRLRDKNKPGVRLWARGARSWPQARCPAPQA